MDSEQYRELEQERDTYEYESHRDDVAGYE